MHNVWANVILHLAPPQAASRFDQLGWHHIGWSLQNWVSNLIFPLILLLAVLFVTLLVSRWRASSADATRKRSNSENRFKSNLQRFGISNDELAYIDVLHAFAKDEEKNSIIEKPEIFERCVDAAIAEVSARSPKEAENTAILITSLRRKIGFSIYPVDKQLYSTRAIPLGQSCALYGTSSNTKPIIGSATVSVNNELSMHVSYKPEQTKTLDIVPGKLIRIAFSRSHDGFYGAQVRVLGLPMRNTIQLGHTVNIKRSQLRKFVRVSANASLKCRMIRSVNPKQPTLAPGQVFETNMSDISGGGVSFTRDKSLLPGDIISLSFTLGSTRISGLQGTILRVSERDVKGKKEFLHHVKFNPIELSDQEKIVRFAFERMRLLTSWNVKKFKG